MISIIRREIVERHRWIADEEFLELLAVAQSLPGILAVTYLWRWAISFAA